MIAEFHSANKSFNLDVSFLNFSSSRVTVASGQTISKVGKRETKSKTIRGGVGIGLLRFCHCSMSCLAGKRFCVCYFTLSTSW